jgi:integrase
MRKAELCGLQWRDFDLEAGKLRIGRQLTTTSALPAFGPTKTGAARPVTLEAETITLLRAQKQHQAEMKVANRTVYHASVWCLPRSGPICSPAARCWGALFRWTTWGRREDAKLIKAANVRPIKCHGLRHTCATLQPQAREADRVVSEHLGTARSQ